ncbi:c-type cytochrome [Lentibacter sp.]|uniref:c-type cytochrome n=1 Tax=Lentibacter sp. TaxID=2024994 RepID=UPI003F6D3C1D
MRRIFVRLIAVSAVCGFAFWQLTGVKTIPAAVMADLTGDPVAGEQVFFAAGCASCHAAPDATGDDKLLLAGGMRFESPFGTFIAPNISPDATHGIGGWTKTDLANAMLYGTSPTGQHYYPAFPYGSYVRMKLRGDGLQDIANLHSYLNTLPAAAVPNLPHEVGFPFNIRRGLGLWKRVFLDTYWVAPMPLEDAELQRGRYLVEALGHCGECHTPRNIVGAPQNANWLTGAPNPSGKGRTPAIDQLDWSASDIAYYLETGFTPEFDSAGGHMAAVVENLAKLPASDRAAIAGYLKALP